MKSVYVSKTIKYRMQNKTVKINDRWIVYDPELMPQPEAELFCCEILDEKGLVTGRAEGRGETCFYRQRNKQWALRHYLRGGLVGKVLHDQYFGLRLKKTRAWQEWHLLNEMQSMGLPVPRPVAASVIKNGLFYRADLITEYLENTKTLSDLLESNQLDDAQWEKIGVLVKRFHVASVYHSDLNARNILIDEQQEVYLIDFDKCCFRAGDEWKNKNLDRLKRSLLKFKSKNDNFNFSESSWGVFMTGYDSFRG